ncbi:MAG TPA: universal stress protein [Bryobacteraceae bacterium]|jgi:nucleotide-binding universal stress UspA family protein|nr:universal stress protein [Bryobacteraceae bacterium]
MRSLAKILLPVDFSERSLGAARYAKTLAKQFDSELTLLHVLTPPHYEFGALEIGGSMLSELYANRAAQVEKELAAFLAADLAGLSAQRIVLEGDPARQIVEYAREHQAGLIVMPTHGYGPFRRFILGSTTAKVLHDADCPVWTGVHLEQQMAVANLPFQHIICAVDLGPQSCQALDWASAIQAHFGAHLSLIHVTAGFQHPQEVPDPEWRADLVHSAMEELKRLQQQCGTHATLVVRTGDPAKTVCQFATDEKADLLVIGRGSAGGVFGRLRTNAYAIIRQSPCPVVSV